MAEQGRWSDERGEYGRDSGRYGRDFERNGNREGAGRSPYDAGARADERHRGEYGDYGQSGPNDPRSLSYGTQAYGVPADYNFRGRSWGGSAQGRYASSGLSGDYNRGDDGQSRFDQSASRFSGNRSDQSGYDRDYGADRYQLSDGRPQEDRSFWSQTRDEVSSWFGDDEARRRRQRDDLRAGEHRGRGPKGYVRSDERIREDVSDHLTEHGRLDASDIEVKVSAGEVTLAGTVARREDKRLAEDLADQVSGVKHVQNNLRIKDAAASATSSASPAQAGAQGRPLTN